VKETNLKKLQLHDLILEKAKLWRQKKKKKKNKKTQNQNQTCQGLLGVQGRKNE
jgi:hypothetical protein